MSYRAPIGTAASLPARTLTHPTRAIAGAACYRLHMHQKILALSLTVCCCSFAAGTSIGAARGVQSRVDAQNSLFEEYYQSELKAHPERATAYGDYRYNDHLDEYSLAALSGMHASDRKFLGRLE